MKYAWIDDQRVFYRPSSLCGVLSIGVSDFRVWKRGGKSHCELPIDVLMLALVRSIHAQVKGPYASPRMNAELRARGFPASKERGER